MKLVTGCEGFIGKRLVERLRAAGENVMGLDVEIGRNPSALKTILDEFEFDGVFHLGAVSATDVQQPDIFYHNYWITKILIDSCVEHNTTMVFASSASCYGTRGTPTSFYGWSKLCAEEYGLATHKYFVALRYFNVYGPGEEHKGNMASLGYRAFDAKLRGEKFKLFPGKAVRDFVYIDDIVDATICAMNAPSGSYDVGTGAARSFEDFLLLMGCEYEYLEEDAIPYWYQYSTKADTAKFMEGWYPKYTLEEGTKKYLEHLNDK
jgi:ADP-L-glycero-D-manno-heptose 6-epimerase